MPPRSMANQVFQIQREATPGTPLTTAMRRYLGLRATPSFTDEGEVFRASGYKVPTTYTRNTEMTSLAIDAPQCYNALLPVGASNFSVPVTTPLPAAPAAPIAYQHVMTLNPKAPDALASFTAQWGDASQAVQMALMVFQTFGIGIERGSLSFSTSAIAREMDTTATLVTAGVTEIPAVPIAARTYDIFADDTWAALGTTKLLAAYALDIDQGEKLVPDWTINSAIAGFSSLLEAEEIDYTGTLRVGFDATAIGLANTFKSGSVKFIRVVSVGPTLGSGITYKAQLDFAILITARGEISPAPNSPAVSLPLEFTYTADSVSGNAAVLTLINTVATL